MYFETDESMLAADTDTNFDVYKRTAGTTTMIASDGTAVTDPSVDATALGVSDDGSRVYFDTTEKITAGDTDSQFDIYDRSAGPRRWSRSASPAATAPSTPSSTALSGDGSRVFFDTTEKLVAADTDSSFDIYERQGATLTLISKGPYAGNGAFHVTFTRRDARRHLGLPALERAARRGRHGRDPGRLPRRSLGGGYPRAKGATPLRASLVPAFMQCTSRQPRARRDPPLNAGLLRAARRRSRTTSRSARRTPTAPPPTSPAT